MQKNREAPVRPPALPQVSKIHARKIRVMKYGYVDEHLWLQIITDLLNICHIYYVAKVLCKPNFRLLFFFAFLYC